MYRSLWRPEERTKCPSSRAECSRKIARISSSVMTGSSQFANSPLQSWPWNAAASQIGKDVRGHWSGADCRLLTAYCLLRFAAAFPEHVLKLLRLLAQLQPIEKEVG